MHIVRHILVVDIKHLKLENSHEVVLVYFRNDEMLSLLTQMDLSSYLYTSHKRKEHQDNDSENISSNKKLCSNFESIRIQSGASTPKISNSNFGNDSENKECEDTTKRIKLHHSRNAPDDSNESVPFQENSMTVSPPVTSFITNKSWPQTDFTNSKNSPSYEFDHSPRGSVRSLPWSALQYQEYKSRKSY